MKRACRQWTAAEQWAMQDMIDEGVSVSIIAARLQRTQNAVQKHAYTHNMRLLHSGNIKSAEDVCRIFGLANHNTVINWINQGWLKATNTGSKQRLWRISNDAILAFIQNDQTWMVWQPERIPDSALREWAQELRAEHPRWLSTREVAARLHVSRATVARWIGNGWISAVLHRTYWINERDLIGFIPP